MIAKDYIKIGVKNGFLEILAEGNVIHYLYIDKKCNYNDPEEIIRAKYYVELIEKYKYPINRIDIEVSVPRRLPNDFADIVVYKDNDKKEPFIIVECKKEGISEAEFNQAIEQAFGYSNSLAGYFAIVVAGNTRRAFQVKDFKPLERFENIIADIPVSYGKIEEWRFKKGDPDWELQIIEKQDLIRILEKCHDTLWQGGKLAPTTAFDELCKIIFVKIRDEKKARKKGEHYDFQIKTHEKPESVFTRINQIYHEARQKDPEVFTDDIKVSPKRLFSVVNHLQGINLNETDLDVKGVAFERFMEDFFKGKIGQYFTPREIVNFMVKMMKPQNEDLVLDPACGSGGFLLHAMDYIMILASEYYQKNTKEHYTYWHDFAEKRLFGIEINDSIARVSKMNLIIHDDGHTNVIGCDALKDISLIQQQHQGFEKEKFDLILTNPPFGATIKKDESPYLSNYVLGKDKKHQKTEILFIERCFDFLKWGTGKLAIVLPNGILTNTTLQYVRDFIAERFQILANISLPSTAFTHYGAGVDSSLLFLRKLSKSEYNLFQAYKAKIINNNENYFNEIINNINKECKDIIAIGSPAQKEITREFEPRFKTVLDNIDELLIQMGIKESKKIKTLKNKFLREKESRHVVKIEDREKIKTARIRLKELTQYLTDMEIEYLSEFQEARDEDWEREIKESYKEKIEFVKISMEEKIYSELTDWIRKEFNYKIFLSRAEKIGFDATGRKCENQLPTILKEYQSFEHCVNTGDFSPLNIGPYEEISKTPLIFIIAREDLEERLDVYYYQPEFRKLELFLNDNYKIKKLRDLGSVFDGPFGSNLKNNEYVDEGIPLLRVQNIKDGRLIIKKENAVYITINKHNELKRSEVNPGDVVITKTGWLGNAAVIPNEIPIANIRADLAGVKLTSKEV